MEAVLLVGGAGTRLRPLTLTTPKPMLPVANFPCTAHQIAKAKAAGVTRIVLSTSYKAEVFEAYFSDRDFGIEIVYVTEDSPLGTGGAIRNVADHLTSGPNDPVVILNGDILSDHDIAAQVSEFQKQSADVSLHLINVEDPRPFGLVPTDAEKNVLAFLEKPQTPEEIVTHQVNAGCYVFRKSVIDAIPAGRVVSVERETFPELLQSRAKVVAYIEDAYWLDLGNPMAFAKGSRDLVLGIGHSPLVPTTNDSLIDTSAKVADSATVSNGSAIAAEVEIFADASVSGSVVMQRAQIRVGAVVQDCIIGAGAVVGSETELIGVVVADGAVIGSHNQIHAGARIWPNVEISPESIRFSG